MSGSLCICSKIRHAARVLTAIYDHALSPSGLTLAQFNLLSVIRNLGKPTITGIAEATQLDRSTLARNLRVLERNGLVGIAPDKNERTRVVEVSDEGYRRVKMAYPLWEAVQRSVNARCGGKTYDRASELLNILEKCAL
jgi:DNA-binding MarR family transcriptional regulator